MKALSIPSWHKTGFLEALAKKNNGRIPVWLMRQAGRFLPEYQALKHTYSMRELFYEKKLISEITKMPLKRFDLDAAIIFSDILLPLEALGSKIILEHQKPPVVEKPEKFNFDQIIPCSELFGFVYEAIEDLKNEIDVPLIGFCGGPLTLMTYLFQDKKDAGEFYELRKWHYQQPQEFQILIDILTEIVIQHLTMQIKAGCDAVQIFDSWAGRFSLEMFDLYAVHAVNKIKAAIEKFDVPMIFFSRNLGTHHRAIPKIKCHAISIDGSYAIQDAFQTSFAIQGNLDPALLLTEPHLIKRAVSELGHHVDRKRWIANLGHGVLPSTPIRNVEAFIEAVHSLP